MAYAAAAGAVLGAAGALKQGSDTYDALMQQAELQRKNALQAVEKGKVDAERQQIISGHHIAATEAAYSASGVTMDSGSVMNVLAASHASAELDRMTILHGATLRALNYENQAGFDERGAKSAREGSYWQAASFGLSGAAKAYGQTKPSGKTPIDDGGGSDVTVGDSSGYTSNDRKTPFSDGDGGYYNDLLDGTGDYYNSRQNNYRVPKGSV